MDKELRRIFLSFVVLKIIMENPIHGYDIIRTIQRRSGGRWTPSAGSIYPILDRFEASGCIRSEDVERRKVYSITPVGERAFERMREKKRQLLKEMIAVIDEEMTAVTDDVTGDTGENGRGR